MAKPRIFISSTFYDLKQVRADLDHFVESLGYEPIRNEEGDIPYGKENALEEYCYKEIKNIDILVSIIGGRFGSESTLSGGGSISQVELRTAYKENKQVYIFIDKNILAEYETYLINKDSLTIKYKYVNDVKIYQFIEEIKGLSANNNIKGFETANDIIRYLKDQFAGLFQRFLEEQTRIKEVNLISNLEKTANTLNKLVTYLSDENKGQAEQVNKILMINHPLVEFLKGALNISYNFYIEGYEDLKELLKVRGFKLVDFSLPFEDNDGYYWWRKGSERKVITVKILENIFDSDKKLKFIKRQDWSDDFVEYIEENKYTNDDLPF